MQKDQQDIESIINGCRNDDRKAQEQLYKNYYRVMMGICLRYTKNDTDALEVLNNAFLKVFKNIKQYKAPVSSIYTWIRTIVIHSCLDFIRSKNRLEKHIEMNEALSVPVGPDIIEKLTAKVLLQFVRKLPAATQAVFNLYVIEGYKHKEIGQLLNITEGTSKWHLSDARKSLQQMIHLEEANING